MLATYLAFAAIAALVVVSPGPATFLLLKNTPVQGRRAGLLNTAGIVAAVLSHAALSLLGVSALILASPTGFTILKLLAAAYLCYLGIVALRETWRGSDFSARLDMRAGHKSVSAVGAFAEGWFTNILNPKPSMFYLSVFPQFLDPSGNLLLQGLALAGLHAGISAAWFSVVVVGIDRIRLLLRRPAIWRGVRAATGLVLIGLAARLATLH
jgi:threonine/homoserine/homoserine lactone efflux protein